MSAQTTRVYSPQRNDAPDLSGAAARKRAAELELMLDLQRELLCPVPPPPGQTSFVAEAYGLHD
jgi:hypothetical protein